MRGFLFSLMSVLKSIRRMGCWSFYQGKSQIVLVDQYSAGSVSVTQDSGTVTGSGTTWTAGMVGRKFRAAGNEVYTITARNSNTEIVVSPVYQGASGSGLTYVIFQDTYDLPSDVDSVTGWWNATNQQWLRPIEASALWDCQNGSNFTSSWPQKITQYGYNNGVPQVVVWPAPETRALLPILYTRQALNPTGPASVIDLPSKMDAVLVQGMVYFMKGRLPAAFREQLASGDLEHERNRFYEMLREEWSRDTAILRGTEYDIAPAFGVGGYASGDVWIAGPAIAAP